jgi:hypothetical protein
MVGVEVKHTRYLGHLMKDSRVNQASSRETAVIAIPTLHGFFHRRRDVSRPALTSGAVRRWPSGSGERQKQLTVALDRLKIETGQQAIASLNLTSAECHYSLFKDRERLIIGVVGQVHKNSITTVCSHGSGISKFSSENWPKCSGMTKHDGITIT